MVWYFVFSFFHFRHGFSLLLKVTSLLTTIPMSPKTASRGLQSVPAGIALNQNVSDHPAGPSTWYTWRSPGVRPDRVTLKKHQEQWKSRPIAMMPIVSSRAQFLIEWNLYLMRMVVCMKWTFYNNRIISGLTQIWTVINCRRWLKYTDGHTKNESRWRGIQIPASFLLIPQTSPKNNYKCPKILI